MPSISDAFYGLKAALQHLYDDGEASAIAHMALDHLTGLSRMQRLSAKDTPLSRENESAYLSIRTQLAQGVPIQYTLGHTLFMGRRFEVSNAVLIPRPETEELVQWIIDETISPSTIIDIGTGSGCIPISIKLALPDTTVSAIDISSAALSVAEQNSSNLRANVHFQESDFLAEENWSQLSSYDVIVSNPPYIPLKESDSLHPNVRDYEPGTALFVPSDDALLFYRKIAHFGITHLHPNGAIYCELHRDYALQTADLFKEAGYTKVTLRLDLHGAERMLRAQL